MIQMTQENLNDKYQLTLRFKNLFHSLTSNPSFLFPVGCWLELWASCDGSTMLPDLKLIFVAFSGGRFPFPNLFFLLGKSVLFPDRLFPFAFIVQRGSTCSPLNLCVTLKKPAPCACARGKINGPAWRDHRSSLLNSVMNIGIAALITALTAAELLKEAGEPYICSI